MPATPGNNPSDWDSKMWGIDGFCRRGTLAMQTVRRRPYKETMWGHLAKYKVSVLDVHSNGFWKKNRKEYPHILPLEKLELNILEPYRKEFWIWFRKQTIELHSDFHHLSSSQAMCFNLFFPFVAESGKHVQKLREVFAVDGVVREARFELILNEQESTNFDLCITADSRSLFEVKLTKRHSAEPLPMSCICRNSSGCIRQR